MTTPPPQGNPFAQGQPQGQNPYAQGQPQAPYPPQGGYPQQPGQPGFPQQGAPYAPVPPEQPRRRFSFKTIKNVAIVIAVLTAVIGGWIASRDDADQAAVGDCLKSASSSSDRMEVVDCTSSEAEVKVLKKVPGHYTELTAETECRKVDEATGFYAETGDGEEFLLCLTEV
ncbi:LppU/SCO3897 family protein [Streptomyces sp. HC307]|uniref:LppU/SCO3897 family protein n=1 Tax=Streptomyces flavusporus TaxID=3385496 RepID=UPI003916FC65